MLACVTPEKDIYINSSEIIMLVCCDAISSGDWKPTRNTSPKKVYNMPHRQVPHCRLKENILAFPSATAMGRMATCSAGRSATSYHSDTARTAMGLSTVTVTVTLSLEVGAWSVGHVMSCGKRIILKQSLDKIAMDE
jgi:hypothetical protein